MGCGCGGLCSLPPCCPPQGAGHRGLVRAGEGRAFCPSAPRRCWGGVGVGGPCRDPSGGGSGQISAYAPPYGTGPLLPGCLCPEAGPRQPTVTPAVATPTADHERLQRAPHHRARGLRRGLRVPEGRHGQDVSAGSEPVSSGRPGGREGSQGCPWGSGPPGTKGANLCGGLLVPSVPWVCASPHRPQSP